MSNPNSNVTPLRPYPETPRFGDGGGDGGTMEARVKALEELCTKIDTKLDTMSRDMGQVRIDMAYIKGKTESLPSTMHLLGFAVAVFAAAGLLRYFATP